jgi:hypothetical protein
MAMGRGRERERKRTVRPYHRFEAVVRADLVHLTKVGGELLIVESALL